MKKTVFVIGLLLSSIFVFSQTKEEQSIRAIMEQQTQDWNAGNVEAFMDGYWKNDSLLFVGKSGPTYGWQKTLNNYKKGYPDAAAMGQLKFDLLQLKPLSADYYFVLGKWHLSRSAGDLEGFFTLLFKKIDQQWVIIADHSS